MSSVLETKVARICLLSLVLITETARVRLVSSILETEDTSTQYHLPKNLNVGTGAIIHLIGRQFLIIYIKRAGFPQLLVPYFLFSSINSLMRRIPSANVSSSTA